MVRVAVAAVDVLMFPIMFLVPLLATVPVRVLGTVIGKFTNVVMATSPVPGLVKVTVALAVMVKDVLMVKVLVTETGRVMV